MPKEADFNANLLDRFLVLLEHKRIHPIIYISKFETCLSEQSLDVYVQAYQSIGYEVVKATEELLPLLTGKNHCFHGTDWCWKVHPAQ